ncbi:DNA (cytosine-5-)-methyltransferase [bacterium]|nr:MAG: DNA (cytosine-5-)-methyltransferase [bacterium]
MLRPWHHRIHGRPFARDPAIGVRWRAHGGSRTAAQRQNTMTFGSLFAGIGGIDLGLERAGLECRWQIETDPFCRSILEKHWPGVPKYGDITTIDAAELEPVDLIAGGYPCQPFSQAGKRAGESDHRHLWPHFQRILCILRPRFALLENVPGHLSLGFGGVLGDLAGLGYDAEWTCLRASDFGASHLRKRVFVVAYRGSQGRRENTRSSSGNEAADGRARRHICEPDGDYEPCGEGANVAYRTSGGLGELRQSYGLSRFGGSQGIDRVQHRGNACELGLPDTEQPELSGPERFDQERTASELCGPQMGDTTRQRRDWEGSREQQIENWKIKFIPNIRSRPKRSPLA